VFLRISPAQIFYYGRTREIGAEIAKAARAVGNQVVATDRKPEF
jgi:hypothetical protein